MSRDLAALCPAKPSSSRLASILLAVASACVTGRSDREATVVSPSSGSSERRYVSPCELVAGGGADVVDPAAEVSFAASESRTVLLVGEERFELDVDGGFSSHHEASGRRVAFALGPSIHLASLEGDSVAIDEESSEESPPLTTWDRAAIRTASGSRAAVLPFRGADGVFAPLVLSSTGAQTTLVVGRGPGTMAAATSERAIALAHRTDGGIGVIRFRYDESLVEAGHWEIPSTRPTSDPLVAFAGPRIVVAWTEVGADARSTARFAIVTPGASIDVHPLSDTHVSLLALGSDEERPVIAWVEQDGPSSTMGSFVIARLADTLRSFEAMTVEIPLMSIPSRVELVVDGGHVYVGTVTAPTRRVELTTWACDLRLPAALRADLPESTPVVVSVDEPDEPDCASPADCEGHRACVTNALGGPLGCTGESCCGASECVNGCVTDADCPRCRPECARSPNAASGTCRNPHGP